MIGWIQLQAYIMEQVLIEPLFILYSVTLVIDILTGNALALYQRKWNSKTGINGTVRHISLFTVVILLLPTIAYVSSIPHIANSVMIYVVTQYTISVLENLSGMGINLNDSFTKYFEFLSPENKTDKQDNKNERGK